MVTLERFANYFNPSSTFLALMFPSIVLIIYIIMSKKK